MIWLDLPEFTLSEKGCHAIKERGSFTRVVDANIAVGRRVELIFLSSGLESIEYIGLAQSGNRVGLDQRSIRISNIFHIGVSLEKIAARHLHGDKYVCPWLGYAIRFDPLPKT